MTDLTKPVRRRTKLIRGPINITLYRDAIGFRRPWQRDEFLLSLDKAYLLAADAYQQQAKAQRKAARAARRAV